MLKTSYRWKHYFSTRFGYTETSSNSRDVSKSTSFSFTPFCFVFCWFQAIQLQTWHVCQSGRCDSVCLPMLGHTQMGQDKRRSKQHDHVLHKNRILSTVFPKLVNEVPRRLVKSSKISKFSTWAERKRMALLMGWDWYTKHSLLRQSCFMYSGSVLQLYFFSAKTQMFASCHGQMAHYSHHSRDFWLSASWCTAVQGQRGRWKMDGWMAFDDLMTSDFVAASRPRSRSLGRDVKVSGIQAWWIHLCPFSHNGHQGLKPCRWTPLSQIPKIKGVIWGCQSWSERNVRETEWHNLQQKMYQSI